MTTVTPDTWSEDRFVASLQKLVQREDRATLAALRRTLGKEPGECFEAHPHVIPWLAPDASTWDETAYLMVAGLFAWHQGSWDHGDARTRNLGASLARLRIASDGSGSVEKRFVALLNCHRDDVGEHLRHVVGLLKAKEIDVDWAQLLRDLRRWDRQDRPVQRAWARRFWGESADANPTEQLKATPS